MITGNTLHNLHQLSVIIKCVTCIGRQVYTPLKPAPEVIPILPGEIFPILRFGGTVSDWRPILVEPGEDFGWQI